MHSKHEVVPIQLQDPRTPLPEKKLGTTKLALRLKRGDGSELLIYNGINQYILAAVLKELS